MFGFGNDPFDNDFGFGDDDIFDDVVEAEVISVVLGHRSPIAEVLLEEELDLVDDLL